MTGTGSTSVPIGITPGRSGFGPEFGLSYDSGSGNGPFGFGWSLSIPSISRKTDKGLPQYQDAFESDVFLLSGSEDLQPALIQAGDEWVRPSPLPRTLAGVSYTVDAYLPRTEGLFARIERWTADRRRQCHWRSIARDNVTTFYGTSCGQPHRRPSRPDAHLSAGWSAKAMTTRATPSLTSTRHENLTAST